MAGIEQDLATLEVDTPQNTGRKKACAPSNWARNIAKVRRNSGKEYVSVKTGRLVEGRQIGTPCGDGCFHKVTMPVIRKLFTDFWAIGNYDAQTAYIQKLVYKVPVKRHRPSKTQTTLESIASSCMHTALFTRMKLLLFAEKHLQQFLESPENVLSVQLKRQLPHTTCRKNYWRKSAMR